MQVFGEKHPDVATNYNNIGLLYEDQGDYAKALEYYNKALEISIQVLGEKHPDVAKCYNDLGIIYYRQGEYAKTLEFFNKALGILQATLGEKHPQTMSIQKNIEDVKATMMEQSKKLP